MSGVTFHYDILIILIIDVQLRKLTILKVFPGFGAPLQVAPRAAAPLAPS